MPLLGTLLLFANSVTSSINTDPAAASAKNGKIAFVVEPDSDEALYTVDPDGGRLIQVGTGENVRFSPDGSRLLFACSSADGEHVAVCTVNPDGSDLTRVTPNTAGIADPPTDFYPTAWSPDGQMILVDAGAGITTTSAGIYTMHPDGTHLTRVTRTPAEQIPWSFSPDGSKILFLDGTDLYVVNTDGTGRTRINPVSLGLDCCLPPRAVWAPDGQRIVFAASSAANGGGSGSALYTVRPNGSGLRQITPGGMHAGLPKWSPDGRWIAFEALAGRGFPEIAIVHPGGSDRHLVTSPADGAAIRPVWSPDGSRLLMSYAQLGDKRAGNFEIWTVKIDGTGLVRLTSLLSFAEAADWGVSTLG